MSVTAQGVLTKRCLFGLAVHRRLLPAAAVTAVRIEQTAAVSGAGRKSVYYSLYLVSPCHPELKVGEDIKGRELATVLAAYLRNRLGVADAAAIPVDIDGVARRSALPPEVIGLLQRGHRVAAVRQLRTLRRLPLVQARQAIYGFLRDNPQFARQPPDTISRLVLRLDPLLPLLRFAGRAYTYLIAMGLAGMLLSHWL